MKSNIKRTVDRNQFTKAVKEVLPKDMNKQNTIFVCIGTDRSTGDSLAPIVGSNLESQGYRVYGTLDNPVHGMNLEEIVVNLPKNKYIVAIDACLGNASSVGKLQVFQGSIEPGSGVGKKLPPVGDYGITGIVNISGFMEYYVLQNTRLSFVLDLAKNIVEAIENKFNPKSYSVITRVSAYR